MAARCGVGISSPHMDRIHRNSGLIIESSLPADAETCRDSPGRQRGLGHALRAADRGSRTHAARRPPGMRQGASGAGPPPAPSDGSSGSDPLVVVKSST
jgi:hypothetical protein